MKGKTSDESNKPFQALQEKRFSTSVIDKNKNPYSTLKERNKVQNIKGLWNTHRLLLNLLMISSDGHA